MVFLPKGGKGGCYHVIHIIHNILPMGWRRAFLSLPTQQFSNPLSFQTHLKAYCTGSPQLADLGHGASLFKTNRNRKENGILPFSCDRPSDTIWITSPNIQLLLTINWSTWKIVYFILIFLSWDCGLDSCISMACNCTVGLCLESLNRNRNS